MAITRQQKWFARNNNVGDVPKTANINCKKLDRLYNSCKGQDDLHSTYKTAKINCKAKQSQPQTLETAKINCKGTPSITLSNRQLRLTCTGSTIPQMPLQASFKAPGLFSVSIT